MTPNTHAAALEVVRSLLSRRWNCAFLDARSLSFTYLAGPIPFNAYVEVNPDMDALNFRAILAVPVPVETGDCVLRLCNFINYRLPMGSFALDASTGDLRWKFGAYFRHIAFSEQLVRDVVEPSICHIDSHVLSLIAAWNGATFEKAVTKIGESPGVGTSAACHYSLEPHPSNVA